MSKIKFLKFLDNVIGRFLCRILPAPGEARNGPVSKVLIIRPGGIGDAALLAPALNALRRNFPEAKIDVLAEKRNAGVFTLVPSVDDVLVYDTFSGFSSCLFRKYDVVIDTEQWHCLSSVVSRLIRARLRIGFDTNERRRMFNARVDYSHDMYEVASFFRLLKPLNTGQSVDSPSLFISEVQAAVAKDLLAPLNDRDYVVVFPGASIVERQWGASKFAELARLLELKGLGIVVVGGGEDRAAGESIVAGLENCVDITGQCNLACSAAVIAGAKLLISGDSGILHIGVGLNKPTVSLFGPGIVRKWGPVGEMHHVIDKKLDCSPCTKFGYTPDCQIGVQCMKQISVDEVYAASAHLLKLGKL